MKKLVCLLFVFLLLPINVRGISKDLIGYEKVYLASYPRSGNGWMRELLEEISGVATSAVYCDPSPPHFPMIFPWGGYSCLHGLNGTRRLPLPGEIVAIKTHYPAHLSGTPIEKPQGKIVRIVRHPLDCIYSLYLLAWANVNLVPEKVMPNEYLVEAVKNWRKFQEYYDSEITVFTVRYEDLIGYQSFEYLKETVKFIGYDVQDKDIARAFNRYQPKNTYLKHLSNYTADQLEFVALELAPQLEHYGYELPSSLE